MTKPTDIPQGHRWCQKCAQALPLSSFSRDSGRASGVQSKCRVCDSSRRVGQQTIAYWTPARLAAMLARVEAAQQHAVEAQARAGLPAGAVRAAQVRASRMKASADATLSYLNGSH